jgi:dolichol-phosphate mannosyltransferase
VATLRAAGLGRVVSRGYSFQQEVLYRCRRAGARIGETPIVFADRRAGVSKVNTREAVRSMSVILSVGVTAFLGLE